MLAHHYVKHEIIPLKPNDCFTIASRVKKSFDFPLHYHEEYELNLVVNAKGAKRIVGDHVEQIDNVDLVLIGPNLYHSWINHECTSGAITEVTIQFHRDLFADSLLKRHQLSFLNSMLKNAQRGISFPGDELQELVTRILNLNKMNAFDSVIEFFSILNELSISRDYRLLSKPGFTEDKASYNSRRIEKVFEYLHENYHKPVSLKDVALIANMPESSFSRFIKLRTGKTFIDSLNEIRLGHASRMLVSSAENISEIAYKCGFNNISNFNRIFKNKNQCIPSEFRELYSNNMAIV